MPQQRQEEARRKALWKEQGPAVAFVFAAALLAGSGAGLRVLNNRLSAPPAAAPPAERLSSRLPMQIGPWSGRDVPLDEYIRRATHTDDLINREYSRGPAQVVGLYVAYGVRARDLMPHRPEVCYPGGGWSLDGSDELSLPLPDGSRLACRLLRFARGGFDLRRIAVLNYYIVDGRCCPDVSLLRSKAWRGSGAIRYMVQVQITCPTSAARDPAAAEGSVIAFATESAQAIRAILPGAAPQPASAGR